MHGWIDGGWTGSLCPSPRPLSVLFPPFLLAALAGAVRVLRAEQHRTDGWMDGWLDARLYG